MVKRFITVVLYAATLSMPLHAQQKESPLWNAPGAGNPFIPGYFADPTIRKFGDTYYLYATTDGTGNGYGPAQVWVSKDFSNWKNIIMNWPTTEVVWAPDVMQAPDGTYRYFYCEPCVLHEGVGNSPIGPWKNVLGKTDAVLVPDRFVHNAITLDGQTFVDDDGSTYLYFGTWGIYKGFGCGVARLNSDLKTFAEKKLIPNTEITDFFEAPYVFKKNGIYYFTYSSGSCHDDTYRVQYATSTVGPMGPYEYKGCILKTNNDQTVHGPGHHSILEKDGKYYIVYHRHNLPRSVHGFNRQICIDEMKFDDKGNILPVVPTHNAQNVDLFKGNSKYRNLAFGAKVTASSYYDDWFRPEYAVDDNNATLWKARRVIGTDPLDEGMINMLLKHPDDFGEWLQIDLGKPMKFNEIWTQFEYATFFYQYLILTSLDGKSWDLFANRSANTIQGSPMIDKKVVKARYVRIVITDTQKNGHMPAIWNVKIWQKAPVLPDMQVESYDGYPGMHKKDVVDRYNHQRSGHMAPPPTFLNLDAKLIAEEDSVKMPTDYTEIRNWSAYKIDNSQKEEFRFKANKPLRLRVKDGHWAFFFNGSQHLTVPFELPTHMRYNAPYFIEALVLPTKTGPVSTLISLSNSHADLATTQFRLGSDPATGLLNHNGSFESCGAAKEILENEGKWQHWFIAYDGWMEKVYLNGKLLKEQNNFLMIRPEGNIVIGADGQGTNNFVGYISILNVTSGMNLFNSSFKYISDEYVQNLYKNRMKKTYPSLGDDNFDESDPDSKFTLSPLMKPVFEKKESFKLSTQSADFNLAPLSHGGTVYKELEGDFVVMTRVNDMEGLGQHSVKGYNEVGLLIADGNTYYQLGAFPLYNCGNMLTVLSPHGRPQFPNSKGYDFDPIMQFERRGDILFARSSKDGVTWNNMPGSPIEVKTKKLSVGVYQTTYSENYSWATLSDFIIYQ